MSSHRPDPGIFREYDIRGTVGRTLHEDDAWHIGRAFAAAVGTTFPRKQICVGYDGRLSSPALAAALVKGLAESGAEVVQVGLGPSPMLYFSVHKLQADGGVMVTGSHNPPDQNGFKFMYGKKAFFGEDIQRLRAAIEEGVYEAGKGNGRREEVLSAYVTALHEAYDGKKPLRIAWDAGNGAAGEALTKLCSTLPGEHILLNAAIDGTFPSHHPDPTVPKNLEQLIACVREKRCDLGIAFDGDGDRIGAVDDAGEILWGDQLLMLFARDVLAVRPGSTIIADVKASQALFDEVKILGGKPLMWKTGHSHIKAKMAESGTPLAGEMSGHIFFADRYFGFDDALYAGVRLAGLLSRLGRPLSEIRRGFPRLHNTPEIRFTCPDNRKFDVIREVAARLRQEGAEFSEMDGVRVRRGQGWWLLRASNTQAVLVARCEAQSPEGLENLKSELRQQLAHSHIDLP